MDPDELQTIIDSLRKEVTEAENTESDLRKEIGQYKDAVNMMRTRLRQVIELLG